MSSRAILDNTEAPKMVCGGGTMPSAQSLLPLAKARAQIHLNPS